MSILDLSQLEAPALMETLDFETIFNEMLARLQSLDPQFSALTESDPACLILEVAAYYRLLDRQRINEAAQAVLIAYASDSDLDQVGARFNVVRKLLTAADTTAVPPVPAVMEADDDFRRRILLALEGMSVAGPANAYLYHALSADAQVADASAISPAPGEVLVTILSSEGDGKASDTILDSVRAALNAEDVRPLTDEVTVQSVALVEYRIEATLYVAQTPASEPILTSAREQVAAYTEAQFRLGRNIRRSAIIAALSVAGVQNVVLTQPEQDLILTQAQAGTCTEIRIVNGGPDE